MSSSHDGRRVGTCVPPTNEPSQIAIRRRFELGGTGLTCVGATLSQDTMVMMGLFPSAVPYRVLVIQVGCLGFSDSSWFQANALIE